MLRAQFVYVLKIATAREIGLRLFYVYFTFIFFATFKTAMVTAGVYLACVCMVGVAK